MKWLLLAPVYLCLWVWTAGALLADLQAIYSTPERKREYYRHDLAMCLGVAALPPFMLISPFVTGFYEHGWTLSPPKPEGFQ